MMMKSVEDLNREVGKAYGRLRASDRQIELLEQKLAKERQQNAHLNAEMKAALAAWSDAAGR